MSRIAKDPVNIPDGVTVASENNTINFKTKGRAFS